MTVYNQEPYVAEAIESIFAQTRQDVELIVVDDGSTDKSAEAVQNFGDRVQYIYQRNQGLGAARNTGLDAARGEFIAFCDADDIHLPFRLDAHAYLLERAKDAAFVFSDLSPYENGRVTAEYLLRHRRIGPAQSSLTGEAERRFGTWKTCAELGVPVPEKYRNERVYQGRAASLIALAHVAWGGASMFRAEMLRAIGGHDPTLRRYTDWYVTSKLAKNYEIIFLDVPVLWYRTHADQLTKMSALGAICYRDVIEKVWKNDPIFYARHKDIVDWALGSAYLQMGIAAAATQDWSSAVAHYGQSFRANPRQKRVYLSWLKSLALKNLAPSRR